ncbi:uncharacterized protein LOC109721133 [Ananas comosus]|uniref:Uncharacterized protein LOC109721133 n=1 Tax=Ananas comosus TaxID=4615 RepID=A0A199VRM6_ANACO|nr:uncharacterized protein LOC109721133 [Ananas comosus]OAY79576.1 hypothetical protein ACMD2_23223 [Ananas comosus]
MAGATRLLRAARAHRSDHLPSSSSSSSSSSPASTPRRSLPSLRLPCSGRGTAEKRLRLNHEATTTTTKRAAASADAAVHVAPDEKQKQQKQPPPPPFHLSSFLAKELNGAVLKLFRPPPPLTNKRNWATLCQILVEKGIVGCQSFSLIAVAGSLVGSILCFVEGCFFVLESFLEYFHAISKRAEDRGEIIKLLIEALDMFLVGTALLTFGMGLYVMFAASSGKNQKNRERHPVAESNFGPFSLKKLKEGTAMQSISEAKSKLGHAIMLILHAGVLDKFKNVPLISGLDLACFAGAVFVSSASVFLLSKLTTQRSTNISV